MSLFMHMYIELPAPINVRATASSLHNVDVTWDKLSDHFTSYLISYTNTATDKCSEINCGNRASFCFDNMKQNTEYIITVQAITIDNRTSAKSKAVSVRTYGNGKNTYCME